MKKLGVLFTSLALAFMLTPVPDSAAEYGKEKKGSHVEHSKDAPVAIMGYCPVCITSGKFMKGDPKFSTEYKGKLYYFPGFEQQKMFLNEPEAYLQNLEEKFKKLKHEAKGSHMEKGSAKDKGSHQKKGSHEHKGSY